MNELLPGLHHWTAPHPNIGARVSSYLVVQAGIVVDPLLPEDGALDALAGAARLRQVVLTSGNHARDAGRIAEHLGLPIRCSAAGGERLAGALPIEPYADGEELAPGVTAIEVGVLSPDEFALLIDVGDGDGALAIADGLHTYGGGLGFFPDHLLGDDAEAVKAGLRERFAALLDRPFDTLLPAHGEPLVGGAKAALRAFVER